MTGDTSGHKAEQALERDALSLRAGRGTNQTYPRGWSPGSCC